MNRAKKLNKERFCKLFGFPNMSFQLLKDVPVKKLVDRLWIVTDLPESLVKFFSRKDFANGSNVNLTKTEIKISSKKK